jgi:hypothetical protein
MSSKVPFPPPGFDDLSADEQADYAGDLWDRVTLREHELSVPDWHLKLLQEREARYEKEGMTGTPWEELEKELFDDLTDPPKDET